MIDLRIMLKFLMRENRNLSTIHTSLYSINMSYFPIWSQMNELAIFLIRD